MTHEIGVRIAIVYSGNQEQRRNSADGNNRFADLFKAFSAKGVHAEPAVYNNDFCNQVREQLLRADGVLVWVNPIEGGRDRSIPDAML